MKKVTIVNVFFAIGVALLSVQSTNSAAITGIDFDCICTREYRPICATDDRTYANKCIFKCAQEKVKNLEMKFEGECDESEKFSLNDNEHVEATGDCICTYEYLPICGSDKVTYSNKCHFECAAESPEGKKNKLTMKFEGECAEAETETADVHRDCICTYDYLPICGTDGVTYPNKCTFECAQETPEGKKKHLGVKAEGPCEED